MIKGVLNRMLKLEQALVLNTSLVEIAMHAKTLFSVSKGNNNFY